MWFIVKRRRLSRKNFIDAVSRTANNVADNATPAMFSHPLLHCAAVSLHLSRISTGTRAARADPTQPEPRCGGHDEGWHP